MKSFRSRSNDSGKGIEVELKLPFASKPNDDHQKANGEEDIVGEPEQSDEEDPVESLQEELGTMSFKPRKRVQKVSASYYYDLLEWYLVNGKSCSNNHEFTSLRLARTRGTRWKRSCRACGRGTRSTRCDSPGETITCETPSGRAACRRPTSSRSSGMTRSDRGSCAPSTSSSAASWTCETLCWVRT